ncbi:MAG: hypothetical protein FIA91_03485 [Geobacter sp.]|nr:hypothetical protein [Geobacter sp.]
MAVDPGKPRKVLVVHGVQTGNNDDLNQDRLVDELIRGRLGPVPLAYGCELFRYEDLNDAAVKKYKILVDLLVANPIGQVVADSVIDLVGDVVISLAPGGTADKIRSGLRDKIMEIYAEGNPCYVVAHSLGSIYTFDVLNSLINSNGLFDRTSCKSWPVQALLTIGSPVGLDMFRITGRDAVKNFGTGDKWFRWLNIWDRNDPVVSGNIFGRQLSGYQIAENFLSSDPGQGWVIRDIAADSGKNWLMAHTAYWHSSVVGDKLVDMITS